MTNLLDYIKKPFEALSSYRNNFIFKNQEKYITIIKKYELNISKINTVLIE